MEIGELLYVTERQAWRDWLAQHHKTASDIWLVLYRKDNGAPSIPYQHAVEEALCFGWIDSIIKKVDEERRAQRYTPRNPKSGYSQINKERLRRLIAQGVVLPEIAESLKNILEEPFVFPEDIMAELRANETAWANFQRYSGPYQRIRIAYIDHARSRPEIFDKRLKNFLRKTEQDVQFGYGIEDFYTETM